MQPKEVCIPQPSRGAQTRSGHFTGYRSKNFRSQHHRAIMPHAGKTKIVTLRKTPG